MTAEIFCRHCGKAGLRLLAPPDAIPTQTIRDDPCWEQYRAIILQKIAEGMSLEVALETADGWLMGHLIVKILSPWDKRWCPRCRHYCWPISKLV